MLEHFEDLLNLSTDCPCDDWGLLTYLLEV